MFDLNVGKVMNFLAASCLLALAIQGIPGTPANAATAYLDQLLQDAKAQADLLQNDSEQMEGFSRSNPSWQSHAAQIDTIKGHVNNMGEIVARLQAARGEAGKPYQEAIDRIVSPLQEVASNTTAIINHLNQSPKSLGDPIYQDYLRANAELATTISQEVSSIVAYANAETKFQKAQDQLQK